ncbi:hypothetical protein AA313_de0204611 [Arthrobotrys entomopaga]|nr:hypothetical protein AA313_de0204611 [Arthrobotrys entomopaga]
MVFYFSEYHADPVLNSPGPPPCNDKSARLIIKWYPARGFAQSQTLTKTVLTHFTEIAEGSELWNKARLPELQETDVLFWDPSGIWKLYRNDPTMTIPKGGADNNLSLDDRFNGLSPAALQELRDFAANSPEMWNDLVRYFAERRREFMAERYTYLPIPPGLFTQYNEQQLEELGLPVNPAKEIVAWNHIAQQRASPGGWDEDIPYPWFGLEGRDVESTKNLIETVRRTWEFEEGRENAWEPKTPPRHPTDEVIAEMNDQLAQFDNYPGEGSPAVPEHLPLRGNPEERFADMAADLAGFENYPGQDSPAQLDNIPFPLAQDNQLGDISYDLASFASYPTDSEGWVPSRDAWSTSNQVASSLNQLSLYSGASFSMEEEPTGYECDANGNCLSDIEEEEDDIDM